MGGVGSCPEASGLVDASRKASRAVGWCLVVVGVGAVVRRDEGAWLLARAVPCGAAAALMEMTYRCAATWPPG